MYITNMIIRPLDLADKNNFMCIGNFFPVHTRYFSSFPSCVRSEWNLICKYEMCYTSVLYGSTSLNGKQKLVV